MYCSIHTQAEDQSIKEASSTEGVAQEEVPVLGLEQMRRQAMGHVHATGQPVSVEERLTHMGHHQLRDCTGQQF